MCSAQKEQVKTKRSAEFMVMNGISIKCLTVKESGSHKIELKIPED